MLFDTRQFNTALLNGGTTIATVYSTDRIVFENFSLSDGTVMVLTDLEDSGPTRDIVGDAVPRGSGLYVIADYFRERKLTARGYVKAASASAMATQLDTIRKSLRAREGSLDVIDDNSTVKRYLATLENYEELFANRQRYHITLVPFKAVFSCRTPFGKARSYSSTSLSFSSSPTSQSFVNSGTYKAPAVFILIFSAASSVTSISIANALTGESISYSGSVTAGDVFQFDGENKQVLKNSSAADFSGTYPNFDLGANVITFTIDGTFSLSMTGKFKTTYL